MDKSPCFCLAESKKVSQAKEPRIWNINNKYSTNAKGHSGLKTAEEELNGEVNGEGYRQVINRINGDLSQLYIPNQKSFMWLKQGGATLKRAQETMTHLIVLFESRIWSL